LATLEQWPELLLLTEQAEKRFPNNEMLIAVKALSLDRLGRTAEARALLSPLIAQGITEKFVLYTHIDIATRCGFLDEAMTAVESLVSITNAPHQKIQALKLLHHLILSSDRSDARAHDVAWRIGELSDQNSELDEGVFLSMLLTSPKDQNQQDNAKVAEFQKRLMAYAANFPKSPILRMGTIPDNAAPDEFIHMLRGLAGDGREETEARRELKENFNSNKLKAPFAWRPRLLLENVRDVPELWEVAKSSRGDERLTLTMANSDWSAKNMADIKDLVPLMDMVALLVAHDLGIFDLIFNIFPSIAIPRETMAELASMAAPITGSIASEKCRDIQMALQANFARIAQPHASKADMSEGAASIETSTEIRTLSHQATYVLYSDDAFFRLYCSRMRPDFQSICTLDMLSELEQQGFLTSADVAEKIGMLCGWGVGLSIEQRWQLASLPPTIGQARTVREGVELLRAYPHCLAIFDGIWGWLHASYIEHQVHAGSILASMLSDDRISPIAIASLMALWREKTNGRPDSPPDDLAALTLLMRQAILNQPAASEAFSKRLWATHFLLVEYEQNNPKDSNSWTEAVSMISFIAAQSDVNTNRLGLRTFLAKMGQGLLDGTAEHLVFNKGYKMWRKSLMEKMKADVPVFTYAISEGEPAYRIDWPIGYRLNLLKPHGSTDRNEQ